jgi:hypothetical protein
MTDKAFEALIRKTADAYNKYRPLLMAAEAEYERRYGASPSDVDDDQWIDSLHGAGGDASYRTVAQIDEGAKLCGLERLNDEVWQKRGAPDSAKIKD